MLACSLSRAMSPVSDVTEYTPVQFGSLGSGKWQQNGERIVAYVSWSVLALWRER